LDELFARLKSLELQGYKTFASKTDFEFSPSVTAIIGPNGSGKSNIADAIRWVLGEQSFSLLRGKRTEDMIFSGSEQRARASMALATITFDNSDGWLPIDFSEVSIGRRAYRDGTNEYILNSQRVRLRDVNELLAKCGLSERTYTVIGQGLVDAALSLRADERRELFEEAAGIGLYRSRRDEALRRLDTTKRNLERVQDILAELRPRLRSLRRQVSRSKDYEQVRSDLREHLRSWYGYQWYRALDSLNEQGRNARLLEMERDKLRERESAFDVQMRELRDKTEDLRRRLQEANRKLSEQNTQREIVGRELAISEERLLWVKEQEETIKSEIESLQEHLNGIDEGFSAAERRVETAEERRLELLGVRQSLIEDGQVDPAQKQNARQRVDQLRSDLDEASARTAVLDTRLEENKRQQQNRVAERRKILEGIQIREEQQNGLREQQTSLQAEIQSAEGRRDESRRNIEIARGEIEDIRVQERELQERLNEVASQLAGHKARREAMESSMGLQGGKIQTLVQANERGEIPGRIDRLIAKVEIESGYEQAVLAALGEMRVGLTFEDENQLFSALDRYNLEKEQGKAVLLPMGGELRRATPAQPEGVHILAIAADVVRAPESYQNLIQNLLGHVFIVPDRKTARLLQGRIDAETRVVTLDGDLFDPAGPVILGQGKEYQREGEELRKLQMAEGELAEQLATVQAQLDNLTAQRADAEKRISSSESGRDQAEEALQRMHSDLQAIQIDLQATQRDVETRKYEAASLAEMLEELEAESGRIEADALGQRAVRDQIKGEYEVALRALEAVEESTEMARVEANMETARAELETARTRLRSQQERRSLLVQDVSTRTQQLERSQLERDGLEVKISESRASLSEVEMRIDGLTAEAAPVDKELRKTEEERRDLDVEEAETRLALQSAEREHAQAQIQLARKQEEVASLRRRIEDDFGLVAFDEDAEVVGQEPLPFDGIVERLPRIETLPDKVEEQLKRLRLQLRRMGPVNPEARREFKEVQERVDFLTSQVDDLRKAENQIHEVIAELDVLMEREFRKTFDAVAIAFKEAFTRLFGGGSARLSLTDPDDLTHSGIDIEARLPGRRMQSLAMLSGGERSLTASALVFALLKVSPTPFCVLDEVDAMLDESNVQRFVDMLTELSQETQFILITHNRLTVQAAQVVYGVSMGGDSASKTISMKLDEVEKEMVA
jgi:chromosome segregation protein